MKYKTTIDIITEAIDKNEAADIAGDYLSGNLVSGVDMKCRTRPAIDSIRYAVSTVVVFMLVAVGGLLAIQLRSSHQAVGGTCGVSAVQPPLRMSFADKTDLGFKKEWQDVQTKEALERIKR